MKKLIITFIFCISALAYADNVSVTLSQHEKMLGQMLMLGFKGSSAEDPGYQHIREFVSTGRVGGVILFNKDHTTESYDRNIYNHGQVRLLTAGLQKSAPMPLFIGIDQEGGRVRRLFVDNGFMPVPSPAEMGAMPQGDVYKIAQKLGKEMIGIGINLNFAPSVDLNINPKNPAIGQQGRSFGKDAKIVIQQAGAFVEGLNNAGVIACFKHFPGHGSSKSDTHTDFTDITDTWQEEELQPYQTLLGKNKMQMVMIAHLFSANLDEQYPATLSAKVITGLLRGKLGYDGVVISDDLQMKALTEKYSLDEIVLLAINAGNDILLFGNNLEYDPKLADKVWQIMLKLYKDGKITDQRIEESYNRISMLKKHIYR